jgi:hypothetical protein
MSSTIRTVPGFNAERAVSGRVERYGAVTGPIGHIANVIPALRPVQAKNLCLAGYVTCVGAAAIGGPVGVVAGGVACGVAYYTCLEGFGA